MELEPDLALVSGIIIAGFAAVAIMSAISERRTPRMSAIMVLASGGLILYALQTKAGGYRFEDIPDAFVRVIAQIL